MTNSPLLPRSVSEVSAALEKYGYLADQGLATVIFLAITLKRPLLLEGESGVGKTEVANVISQWTGGKLIRLACYEGITADQEQGLLPVPVNARLLFHVQRWDDLSSDKDSDALKRRVDHECD